MENLPSFYYDLFSRRGTPVSTLRKLEKSVWKTEKRRLDVEFWQRCVELGLCPEYLKFKPPKNKLYHRVEEVYEFVVKKSLMETKKELAELDEAYMMIKHDIAMKITDEEWEKLEHMIKDEVKRKMNDIKATHNRKLLKLWLKQRPRSPDCLINLSQRNLTLEEKNVLYRGLNHHILPPRVNSDQLRVNIERMFKSMVVDNNKDDTAHTIQRTTEIPDFIRDEVRCLTRNFLQAAKSVCSSRRNQAFHKHLKTLTNDDNLAVLKYDKGNGVCIMNKEDYLSKLDVIVDDETKFVRVQRSKRKNALPPLTKRQDEIKTAIKEHLAKHVSESTTKWLKPSGTNTGKLYGTCKVHKPGFPVRPIVSMVNTPVYNLAKYLDNIIKPSIPDKFSINSNTEFLERLKGFRHKTSDFCISFDVVSLFTNIPLNQTIGIVADYLYAETNTNKPTIPRTSFVSLLKCATGGIFSHKGQLYKQTDGVSMGNPLAPTLANFFMGHMESGLLTTEHDSADEHHTTANPALYVRYVDDVFCIFRQGDQYENFLSKLNNLHPNLRFTYEFGGESLPFLDTKVTLEPPYFSSTVFRKNTDTSVVMNYRSMAPTKWKTALIKWFIHRADRVCSETSLLNREIDHLRSIFEKNGYPQWLFDRTVEAYRENQLNNGDRSDDNDDGNATTEKKDPPIVNVLKVPYIGRPSILFVKKLKKVLKNIINDAALRITYSTSKVKDHFRVKDSDPHELLSKVVYRFKCRKDPAIQYIGYTNRHLKERVSEHLRGGTRVSDHIASCWSCRNTKITTEDFDILKKCRNRWDTSVYEALLIKRHNPVLNIQLVKPGYSHKLTIFN
jgi:hypothetical protein